MDIKLIHGGLAEYDLNNYLGGGLLLLQQDGLGPANVERLKQRTASQHGVIDAGYYVNPRRINLKLAAIGDTWAQYASMRDILADICAPANVPMVLQVTRPDGAVRQIECHFEGALPLDSKEGRGAVQIGVLTLYCPDPFFFDPVQNFISFSIAGGGSGWVVPVTIPMNFGASTLDQTFQVTYTGNVEEFPIIEIVGPITNPVVYNLTTGEKLDFTGITINAGKTYQIDCRPRYKTVKDETGADKIAEISDNGDLTTFHLASKREVVGGLNTIRVTGTSVSTASVAYMRWFNRYIGV